MKPALDAPARVSHDPYQKTVHCLRCQQRLERYYLMKITLAPGVPNHAVLSCQKCGHVELVTDSSPLLFSLELVPADSGDGD